MPVDLPCKILKDVLQRQGKLFGLETQRYIRKGIALKKEQMKVKQ